MSGILAMLPWGSILDLGLKAIGWVVKDKNEKDDLRRKFIKFIKRHDNDVLSSLKAREDYRKILDEIQEEDEDGKAS